MLTEEHPIQHQGTGLRLFLTRAAWTVLDDSGEPQYLHQDP